MKTKTEKLVYGVGTNNADYAVQRKETFGCVDEKKKQNKVWVCKYYQTWVNMLRRCYSAKYQERQPTYVGCSVSEEWRTFSVFKDWMEKQDFEGKHLDKDLLIEGNKIYSQDTCVFITGALNNFTTDSRASRGEFLLGVSWHKGTNKFQSSCSNPITQKREHLGRFDSEQEAHNAWLKRKIELAHELAAIQKDPRVAKALIDR